MPNRNDGWNIYHFLLLHALLFVLNTYTTAPTWDRKKKEIKIRQGKYHLAIQVGDALLSFKEKNHQPRQRVNHFRSIHGNLLARIRKSTILFSNSETEPYWRGGKKGWSLLEFVSGWILAISTEFYEPECHGSRKKAKTSDQSEQREIVFFFHSLSLSFEKTNNKTLELKGKKKQNRKTKRQENKEKKTRGPDVNAVGSGWQSGWCFSPWSSNRDDREKWTACEKFPFHPHTWKRQKGKRKKN